MGTWLYRDYITLGFPPLLRPKCDDFLNSEDWLANFEEFTLIFAEIENGFMCRRHWGKLSLLQYHVWQFCMVLQFGKSKTHSCVNRLPANRTPFCKYHELCIPMLFSTIGWRVGFGRIRAGRIFKNSSAMEMIAYCYNEKLITDQIIILAFFNIHFTYKNKKNIETTYF